MEAAMDRETEVATEHPGAPTHDDTDGHVHPLDEEPTEVRREPDPEVVRRRRGLGANRHVGSVVLCLLAVLAAYGALDYGFERARAAAQTDLGGGALSDRTIIALGVAAACLLLAGAAGRISGLGPLLTGLVLGVAPAAWVSLDFSSYVHRLDDVPELWDHTTFGLSYAGFALYPAVAGLLLGAAIAGRWRRVA
jgi:hypothetical protein